MAKIAADHSCPRGGERSCKYKSKPEIEVFDPQITVSDKRKGVFDATINLGIFGPIHIHFIYEFWYAKAEAQFRVYFVCAASAVELPAE